MSLPRILAALALVSLASCDAKKPWPPEPSEIALGEESCAMCSMIVSDDHFAAQVKTREGTLSVFDDLGCLLVKAGPSRPDPAGVFVRAFDGSGWVRGDRATVVRSPDFHSPMGFGFASFASRDAAEAEARRHAGATVVSLDSLLREGAPPSLPTPANDAAASQGEAHR